MGSTLRETESKYVGRTDRKTKLTACYEGSYFDVTYMEMVHGA